MGVVPDTPSRPEVRRHDQPAQPVPHPGPHPVELARRAVGADEADHHHAARGDRRLHGHGLHRARHRHRSRGRRGDRGLADGSVQCPGQAAVALARRAAVAGAHRDPGDRPPDPRLPGRRSARPGRRGRYVLLGADRLVHLCRDQHDAHGDPGCGSGRFVLRAPGVEPAVIECCRANRPARAGHHPDRRPGAPDPRRTGPRRLRQYARQLDPQRQPHPLARGRPSCRR